MKNHKELSKRLDKIEKHLGLNTEVSVSKFLRVQLPTPGFMKGMKPELTELPEKWCISAKNKEEAEAVYNWLKENKNTTWGLGLLEIITWCKEGNYVCYPASGTHLETHKIYKGSLWSYPNYTEITFDQFNKWVLKEEERPDLGNTDTSLSIRKVQVKVTSQEEVNECTEIAKGCGELIISRSFDYLNTYFRLNNAGGCFILGKRTESKKEISIQEYRERFGKSKEIDWSKAGQLVESDDYVVGVIMSISQQHFKGVLLKIKEHPKTKNDFEPRGWDKDKFKLCTEPITLENERN